MKKFLPACACRSAFLLLLVATSSLAQSPAADHTADRSHRLFQYDVVSIKPHRDSSSASGVYSSFNRPNYGISAENISALTLVENAYDLEESRIYDMPNWTKSETYEVEARTGPDTIAALEKLPPRDRIAAERQMMQALLADRFKIALHHETKQLPVYEMVVAARGMKLLPADLSSPMGPGIAGSSDPNGNNRIRAKMATTDALARFLSGRLRRMVLNKTGLTDRYEFTLIYFEDPNRIAPPDGANDDGRDPATPPPASLPGATGRSLFDAIQEQLGLKLVPAKAPVEIIVIDHIERPSPN